MEQVSHTVAPAHLLENTSRWEFQAWLPGDIAPLLHITQSRSSFQWGLENTAGRPETEWDEFWSFLSDQGLSIQETLFIKGSIHRVFHHTELVQLSITQEKVPGWAREPISGICLGSSSSLPAS